MPYAKGTQVATENSKAELKRVIYKNGGANYQYAESEDRAMVMFMKESRAIRFVVMFLPPGDAMFVKTPSGRRTRTKEAAYKEYEAEQRRRWRSLILSIKAKFEIVESGIASFETEFMPYVLLPNKQTVAEIVAPLIKEAYDTKKMPRIELLPR
jgi:hypothetical protein